MSVVEHIDSEFIGDFPARGYLLLQNFFNTISSGSELHFLEQSAVGFARGRTVVARNQETRFRVDNQYIGGVRHEASPVFLGRSTVFDVVACLRVGTDGVHPVLVVEDVIVGCGKDKTEAWGIGSRSLAEESIEFLEVVNLYDFGCFYQ